MAARRKRPRRGRAGRADRRAGGPRRPMPSPSGVRRPSEEFCRPGLILTDADPYWVTMCPAMSLCLWLVFYSGDLKAARADWWTYWRYHLKSEERRWLFDR